MVVKKSFSLSVITKGVMLYFKHSLNIINLSNTTVSILEWMDFFKLNLFLLIIKFIIADSFFLNQVENKIALTIFMYRY